MSDERSVRWEEMLPDDLLAAIGECPVCYCPYGLAEPHGVYNAIGLDWLKAQALCERTAREHGGVVMPPFCWHVQETPQFHVNGWNKQAGIGPNPLASSIPKDLWLRLALYQIRAVDARGFHAAVLVTGHYGGIERDLRLLCEYYTRRSGSPLRLYAIADWEAIDYEGYRGDHAGIVETSQLMALRPGLTYLDRRADDSPLGRFTGREFPTDDGRVPSRELGEKIVASQVRSLGETARDLLAAHEPAPDWSAPSLTDTEAIWARFGQTMTPYLGNSTYEEFRERRPHREFPGWDALGE